MKKGRYDKGRGKCWEQKITPAGGVGFLQNFEPPGAHGTRTKNVSHLEEMNCSLVFLCERNYIKLINISS